jgi:polysaccharide biosynthesis/export protein
MLILTSQFRLEPMAIVYVTATPIERWNKLLTQLTNSFSNFYMTDRALADN